MRLIVKIKKENISLFQHIVESYDGLANVSTISADNGTLALDVMSDTVEDALQLLHALKEEFDFLEISDHAGAQE